MSSGLTDLLFEHASGRSREGAIGHLGIVAHLNGFVKLLNYIYRLEDHVNNSNEEETFMKI